MDFSQLNINIGMHFKNNRIQIRHESKTYIYHEIGQNTFYVPTDRPDL